MLKKPDWLRVPSFEDQGNAIVEKLLEELSLNTVCVEANCPNRAECFSQKIATFLILGTNCTRDCRFCNVSNGPPLPVDEFEPEKTAGAVKLLELKYAVITSVTRDDLSDGGAGQFADVIHAIHKTSPQTTVEVLVPDFNGSLAALEKVTGASPAVTSHNMETVQSLYATVRPGADYTRSLDLLRNIKRFDPDIRSKSGIMLGLGETRDEILCSV
jgi:lipoic acid synthetase